MTEHQHIRLAVDDRVTPVLEQMQLDEQERQFWEDSKRWLKEGSGMTREQEAGAAMVWSWLSSRIGRAAS